jgi:hypothetical protein
VERVAGSMLERGPPSWACAKQLRATLQEAVEGIMAKASGPRQNGLTSQFDESLCTYDGEQACPTQVVAAQSLLQR